MRNCPNFAIETMWAELEIIQKLTFQKTRNSPLTFKVTIKLTCWVTVMEFSFSTGDRTIPLNKTTSVLKAAEKVAGQHHFWSGKSRKKNDSSKRDSMDSWPTKGLSPTFSSPGMDSNEVKRSYPSLHIVRTVQIQIQSRFQGDLRRQWHTMTLMSHISP